MEMDLYPWLKNSKVYEAINNDEEEDISQCVKYLCQPTIHKTEDVAQIVGAIQYWDVHEIPPDIILYFATHLICPDAFNFIIEFEWLDLFTKLYDLYNKNDDLSKEYCYCIINIPACHEFCTMYKSCVRMDIYKVLMTNDNPNRPNIILGLIRLACYYGNIDCLVYSQGVLLNLKQILYLENLNSNVYFWCIIGKQLDCLKYAYNVKYGIWIDMHIIACAIMCGHLEILMYVMVDPLSVTFRLSNKKLCIIAADYGHYNCLKFLHEKGAEITDDVVRSAIRRGNMDCIKYVLDQHCNSNIARERAIIYAVTNGKLECLKYMHDCQFHSSNACEVAAANGQLECLKYLHENGYPWDSTSCRLAVKNRHLECLIYLHQNNCPWNDLLCIQNIYKGYLASEWLFDDNFLDDPYIDFIKYLHKNGWCSWNKKKCNSKRCNECKYFYQLEKYCWY